MCYGSDYITIEAYKLVIEGANGNADSENAERDSH